MEKRNPQGQSNYFFNEEGKNEVSEQIMDAYNSGVIDQLNSHINLDTEEAAEGELQGQKKLSGHDSFFLQK